MSMILNKNKQLTSVDLSSLQLKVLTVARSYSPHQMNRASSTAARALVEEPLLRYRPGVIAMLFKVSEGIPRQVDRYFRASKCPIYGNNLV